MGITKALLGAAILALVFASTALAEEPVPPMPDAPPAGVALPSGEAPPPPPPPSDTVILVPPQPAYEQPIYPTDQPQNRDVDPYAPTVRDFDATTNAVRMRTGPCAPRMAPRPMPCPSPCDPCPAPFDPCDPCAKPCFKGYGGISIQAYPGLGVGVLFGGWFARTGCANFAWEVGLSYQDLTDGFNNISTGEAGKWTGARVGVKASFLPDGNHHPTLRAGFGWNIATGDVSNDYDLGDITETDFAVNYFGGYLGIGYEFDLFNGAITTGPEIWGFAGFGDRDSAEAYTATVAWHFLVNF